MCIQATFVAKFGYIHLFNLHLPKIRSLHFQFLSPNHDNHSNCLSMLRHTCDLKIKNIVKQIDQFADVGRVADGVLKGKGDLK